MEENLSKKIWKSELSKKLLKRKLNKYVKLYDSIILELRYKRCNVIKKITDLKKKSPTYNME